MESYTVPEGLAVPKTEGETWNPDPWSGEYDQALRYNKGKLRMDLIPPELDRAYAEIGTMGAEKYAPRNWELGMDWMKMIASLKRHLNEWELGNDTDSESGYNHMKHVLWNAGSLVTYIERGIGNDDRPSRTQRKLDSDVYRKEVLAG